MATNKKELRRIRELAGLVEKSGLINSLYDNFFVEDYHDVEMDDTLPGLEGPFKMKNGRVVYYDPREGQYYDRRTDMYLSDEEAAELFEDVEYVDESIVIRATKGTLTENFKVGSIDQVESMALMLKNNGYSNFEITDSDVLRAPYAPETQSVEEAKSAAQQAAIAISKKERGEKVEERELTKAEKEKLERLKKKYDDSGMKASMKKQYGDEWKDVFYGKLTKMAKEGKNSIEEDDDPCWDGYKQVGMKKQNGKEVPNCVKESFEMSQELFSVLRGYAGGTADKKMAMREVEELFPTASKTEIEELFDKVKYVKATARQDVPSYPDNREGNWRAFQDEMANMNASLSDLASAFTKDYAQDYTDMSMRRGEMGMNEAEVKDTSKKFSKGDEVEYKGKKMFVVVPDGKANLVGIAPTPDGKVDMVKASELHKMLNDKEEKHDKKKEVKEGDDKESIKKEIEKLKKDKIMTAGHGRRARIQDKIDDLEAKLKKLDEGQNTFSGWKAAVKKKHGSDVEFEGDKDICQAFVNKDGKRKGVGEWDGDKGELHEAAVNATYYDNDAMPANAVDDMQQKAERTGQAERVGIEMKTPKDVMDSIDQRLAEIKDSIDRYDRKGYNEKSVKANAVEALEQIKRNLSQNDQEGFMEAQVYFGTLMSPIWDLLPAKVVNYLAKGPYEQQD